MQPGKRTSEPFNPVADNWQTKSFKPGQILIGIEHQASDLVTQARNHMLDHRLPVKQRERLVGATAIVAHPAAETTGEDQPGNV